jgi:hypothetical protein
VPTPTNAVPLRTFEGFSISHAGILNGTTGAEEAWGDVYGVRDGSLDVDTDSYDNTGDEAVLSTWSWFNFATVTVQGGYVPFDLLANLSGDTISSSGVTPADYYNVPLWSEKSLNQPRRPMYLRVPSKNAAGVVRNFDFILYAVQFEPFSFDGPTYKDGLLLNYSGRALMSSTDEKGVNIATTPGRAIGRIVNFPGT